MRSSELDAIREEKLQAVLEEQKLPIDLTGDDDDDDDDEDDIKFRRSHKEDEEEAEESAE